MGTTINVNGVDHVIEADDDTPLLWVLRDILHMYGTKFGCGAGLCGACTVHLDGQAQFACQTPINSIAGAKISTIEAMQDNPIGRVVQDAWVETDVVQCGYCQSGQVMRATAFLAQNPDPTDADIRDGMSTNICRCGCYARIFAAVKAAAARQTGTAKAA